jgi:hypothetical protein
MTNIIHLKDHRPGTKSDIALAPSAATKTQPGLAVAPVLPVAPVLEVALEQRISARRAELIAKLIDHRGSMHLDEVDAGDKIKAKLSELAHIMREGVVDGWADLGDGVKLKLEGWLTESAHVLALPVAVAPKEAP